jgi:hypothetical protein
MPYDSLKLEVRLFMKYLMLVMMFVVGCGPAVRDADIKLICGEAQLKLLVSKGTPPNFASSEGAEMFIYAQITYVFTINQESECRVSKFTTIDPHLR